MPLVEASVSFRRPLRQLVPSHKRLAILDLAMAVCPVLCALRSVLCVRQRQTFLITDP